MTDKTYRGKPLTALTDAELIEAVGTILYQSLGDASAIMREATRRVDEEGVDIRANTNKTTGSKLVGRLFKRAALASEINEFGLENDLFDAGVLITQLLKDRDWLRVVLQSIEVETRPGAQLTTVEINELAKTTLSKMA